jgi:hypothetical protein
MSLNADTVSSDTKYCKYCTDPNGHLLPKEQVKFGIAQFLILNQPGLEETKAIERAGYYMKAMPAWAE